MGFQLSFMNKNIEFINFKGNFSRSTPQNKENAIFPNIPNPPDKYHLPYSSSSAQSHHKEIKQFSPPLGTSRAFNKLYQSIGKPPQKFSIKKRGVIKNIPNEFVSIDCNFVPSPLPNHHIKKIRWCAAHPLFHHSYLLLLYEILTSTQGRLIANPSFTLPSPQDPLLPLSWLHINYKTESFVLTKKHD